MSWSSVGEFLKNNVGSGVALVGSLLTGNVPTAIAAGVALVSSATGTDDPKKVLEQLQTNPETLVSLRRLANENEANIREHIATMTRLELEDKQREHETTQKTIRAGDVADDSFVRQTRPGQAWISLMAAIWYALNASPDVYVLGLLLTLPFTYAGLREVGKGIGAFTDMKKGLKR